MAPSDLDHGADPFDAELQRLTDHQRRAEAADARRREHWLRHQAAEDGTFAGVLLDLAERRRLVALCTVTGRVVRGTVRTVGADFVSVRATGGERSLLPLRAITSIRAEPGASPTVGDRAVEVDTSFTAVLGDLASERPSVSLHTFDGEGIAGNLRSAGRDLVTLRSDPGGTTFYVPLAAVSEITLR
jgi:hypothetical protein